MASSVVSQMLRESRRQVRKGKGLRDIKRHKKDATKGRDLPRGSGPKHPRGGAYHGPAGPDEVKYAHVAGSESGQIDHSKWYDQEHGGEKHHKSTARG